MEFYCFEQNRLFGYRELRYGRFCLFLAIIWQQNPQLSRYWADILKIGAYAQIWSYIILLITQPILSHFDKTLHVFRRLVATRRAPLP